MPFKRLAGRTRNFFSKIDLLNLPNPEINVGENVLKEDFHVLELIYDDET